MEPLSPQDPKNIGPWKLLNRIGAGGMGVVFYAEQKTKRVALKVVRNSFLDSPELKSRLEREVELMSQINSIRVAKVIDSGTDDAFAWVATEYINGPDLKEKVLSDGPLNRDEWFELGEGLLEALVAVHATGVIHRDIKPSNILLADSGPKLIDFGIAQVSDATSLTAAGVVAGSPAWLSPEQIHGDEITSATDIFSAGSVLVFAANGKSPWGDTTSTKTPVVFNRISNEKPDLESLSFYQKKIVEPMLEKKFKNRSSAKDSLNIISNYSKIDEEARLSELRLQEQISQEELARQKEDRIAEARKEKEEQENEQLRLKLQDEKNKLKAERKKKRSKQRKEKKESLVNFISNNLKKISLVSIVLIIIIPIGFIGINAYISKSGPFFAKLANNNAVIESSPRPTATSITPQNSSATLATNTSPTQSNLSVNESGNKPALVDNLETVESNSEKVSETKKPESKTSAKAKICREINGRGSGCWAEGATPKIGPCVSIGDYWYQSEFIKNGQVVDRKIGNFTINENVGIDDCIYGSNKQGKESVIYPPAYFELKNQIDSVNTVVQGNGWNEYIIDYYTW